jgi:N6-adenosine-specific RNA methylase IME4
MIADRGRHSKKPDKFYDYIEERSAGPYLELFARNRREGWTSLGNQVDGEALPGRKKNQQIKLF